MLGLKLNHVSKRGHWMEFGVVNSINWQAMLNLNLRIYFCQPSVAIGKTRMLLARWEICRLTSCIWHWKVFYWNSNEIRMTFYAHEYATKFVFNSYGLHMEWVWSSFEIHTHLCEVRIKSVCNPDGIVMKYQAHIHLNFALHLKFVSISEELHMELMRKYTKFREFHK